MSYGIVKVYQTSIASGDSTAQFDLGDRGWRKVFLDVGSMSTAVDLNVLASPSASGFRQVYMQPFTDVVSFTSFFISGSVNSGIVPLNVQFQYLKFVASAVISGGVSLSVICSD